MQYNQYSLKPRFIKSIYKNPSKFAEKINKIAKEKYELGIISQDFTAFYEDDRHSDLSFQNRIGAICIQNLAEDLKYKFDYPRYLTIIIYNNNREIQRIDNNSEVLIYRYNVDLYIEVKKLLEDRQKRGKSSRFKSKKKTKQYDPYHQVKACLGTLSADNVKYDFGKPFDIESKVRIVK